MMELLKHYKPAEIKVKIGMIGDAGCVFVAQTQKSAMVCLHLHDEPPKVLTMASKDALGMNEMQEVAMLIASIGGRCFIATPRDPEGQPWDVWTRCVDEFKSAVKRGEVSFAEPVSRQ